jgi:hypothetical protein
MPIYFGILWDLMVLHGIFWGIIDKKSRILLLILIVTLHALEEKYLEKNCFIGMKIEIGWCRYYLVTIIGALSLAISATS